jgi:hypothetical protein
MQSNNTVSDYFDALNRIKEGKPIHVNKHIKISNDAVAVEAGRKKGSIKKSRGAFADLILAIDSAAAEQAQGENNLSKSVEKFREKAEQYRSELEAALAREVSLLYELYETKKKLAKITGTKVIPLRKT